MYSQLFNFFVFTFLLIFATTGSGLSQHDHQHKKKDVLAGKIKGLEVNNLLSSELELTEGVEVVVSHLVVPPNTTLPKHWHPGEEFVYVLEGSGILWQKDKEDIILKKGEVYKVPLEQIHTAKTLEETATVLVFRVHKKGEPVRVPVED